MTTATKGMAIATAEDSQSTLFSVRYVGHADMDSSVPYDYLRGLVREGWRVTVEASAAAPAYMVD